MNDQEETWENKWCPEVNEGLHHPRVISVEPTVSPLQVEAELNVRCVFCGEEGLLTLNLEQVMDSIY